MRECRQKSGELCTHRDPLDPSNPEYRDNGNRNTTPYELIVNLDTKAPVFTTQPWAVTPTKDRTPTWYWEANDGVGIGIRSTNSWQFFWTTSVVDGLAEGDWTWSSGIYADAPGVPPYELPLANQLNTEGIYKAYVVVWDELNNTSTSQYSTVELDYTVPSTSVTINAGASQTTHTNSQTVTLKFKWDDSDKVCYKTTSTIAECGAVNPDTDPDCNFIMKNSTSAPWYPSPTDPFNFEMVPDAEVGQDGERVVCAVFEDAATNRSRSYDTILYDTHAPDPDASSMVIRHTQVQVDEPVWTNIQDVYLHIDAIDSLGWNPVQVNCSNTSSIGDGQGWAVLDPTKAWELSATESANKQVNCWLRDAGGNSAYLPLHLASQISDTIGLDMTDPPIPGTPVCGENHLTPDQQPTWSWTQQADNLSGVDHYEVCWWQSDQYDQKIETTYSCRTTADDSTSFTVPIVFEVNSHLKLNFYTRAFDAAGNASEYSESGYVYIYKLVPLEMPVAFAEPTTALNSEGGDIRVKIAPGENETIMSYTIAVSSTANGFPELWDPPATYPAEFLGYVQQDHTLGTNPDLQVLDGWNRFRNFDTQEVYGDGFHVTKLNDLSAYYIRVTVTDNHDVIHSNDLLQTPVAVTLDRSWKEEISTGFHRNAKCQRHGDILCVGSTQRFVRSQEPGRNSGESLRRKRCGLRESGRYRILPRLLLFHCTDGWQHQDARCRLRVRHDVERRRSGGWRQSG